MHLDFDPKPRPMLPTSGYFKDIVCPFLKTGLCERTHCHYRHDQRYEVRASTSKLSSGESIPDYVPTPVSKLKSIRSQTIAGESNTSDNDKLKTRTKFQNIYQNIPEYKPTPISQLKRKQTPDYSFDETTSDEKPKSSKSSVNSSDEVSNGKHKTIVDKSDKIKNKNVIKNDLTKFETKTKKTISKLTEESEKSPKKESKSRTLTIDQSLEFESDFNEELFQSLRDISSTSCKKSFDEIISGSDESYESVTKKVRIAHQNTISVFYYSFKLYFSSIIQ